MIDRAWYAEIRCRDKAPRGRKTNHFVPDEVVNPIDLFLLPSVLGNRIHHLLCTVRILSERLLNNKSVRGALVVVLVQLVRERGELTGRNGELKTNTEFSTRPSRSPEKSTHVVDTIRLAVEILVCQLLQFLFQILESIVFVVGAFDVAADLLELFYFILGLWERSSMSKLGLFRSSEDTPPCPCPVHR
jgi:hypothetical protein